VKKLVTVDKLLIKAVEDLDEDRVMKLVDIALNNGIKPLAVLDLIKIGVERVGKLYENKKYFIADLIMAGLIFREVLELDRIKEQFQRDTSKKLGKLVIGTVKGDLHDIGKDLFIGMMEANGFETVDLGVDVSKEEFVKSVLAEKPDIVGLSGVLTFTIKSMKDTVDALVEAGVRNDVKIILGGNHLTKESCEYIGADFFTNDASVGVEYCKRLMINLNREEYGNGVANLS